MSPEVRFRQLFDAHHRALLAYAMRRVSVREDAADVVAETFLVLWRRIDDVPRGADALPWLYGVARKVLGNHHRGERRQMALADRLREQVAGIAPEPTWADTRVGSMLAALGTLAEDDRELLRLVAWEGLTPTQVAASMELAPGTVRVRLHRARERLRQALQATDAEGVPPGRPPAPNQPAYSTTHPVEEHR